ncbi:MAG: hypothetical protein QMC67_04695 [Candidatus Wallbacteria bacterium]
MNETTESELKWLHDFLPYIAELFSDKKEDIGFDHCIRAMNIARYISTLEHADKDMSALLCLLSKFTVKEINSVLPLLDKDEEFKKQFIVNFQNFIIQIDFSVLEVKVAHDAICLESMGAIGIVRHFYRGASENLPLKLLIKNFDEKIMKLKASIQTETGKNMSVERQNFITTFLNRLKGETVWENL